MTHKFAVGQTVTLEARLLRAAVAGDYEIRCLMPVSDNSTDEPRYRVKSASEGHERVVPECDLSLAGERP
jgi:hypothetical protein